MTSLSPELRAQGHQEPPTGSTTYPTVLRLSWLDYMAGQALPGLLARQGAHTKEFIRREAYDMAEHMLIEAEERRERAAIQAVPEIVEDDDIGF